MVDLAERREQRRKERNFQRALRNTLLVGGVAAILSGGAYLLLPSSKPELPPVSPTPLTGSPSSEAAMALATRVAVLSPEPTAVKSSTPILRPQPPVGTEPQISQQYAKELSTGQTLDWLIRTTEAGNEVTLVECNSNMEGIVNPDSGARLSFSPDGTLMDGFGLDASSAVAWRKGIEVTGPNRNDVFVVDPKVTGNGNPNTPDSGSYFALSERQGQSPAIIRINRGPIDCVRVNARRTDWWNRK
jgi:hypothetical protein